MSERSGWRLSAAPRAMCLNHLGLCRPEDASSAKYSLMHTVRTHLGRRHDAFSCMVWLSLLACAPGTQ